VIKRSPLLVIFLTVFIDLLGFGIVVPLLPRYAAFLQKDGQAPVHSAETAPALAAGDNRVLRDDAILGMLMASFSAMQFLFAPVWGRASDRIGRRPVLIVGLFSSAVFYALFSYAIWMESLWWIFVARIGAGIAGATIPTAQAYIADSTSDSERGRGMALIGAAFGIGFTFGPLLGALWVSDDPAAPPSAAPGLVAAALSFLAFCLALAILPESLRPGSSSAARPWLSLKSLRSALAVPTIGTLLATFFVATFAFANFEGTLARLTQDTFGLSDRYNFYLFAYIGFLLSLAQGLLVRRLIPIVGEVVMTVTGAALMGGGLLGIGFSAVWQSRILVLCVLPIAVAGFAALTPSVQSLISRRSGSDIQGEVLGVAQSASSLARILGPFAGNVLYGYGLAHAFPYFVGAAVMGAAFLLSLGILETEYTETK
jgi:MFS family permease